MNFLESVFIVHVFVTIFTWIKWSYGYENQAWYRLLMLIVINSLFVVLYGFGILGVFN